MEQKKIGIVILATNAYFVLGVTFIKKFSHHYKGGANITFYFFSDVDPKEYLPEDINVEYYHAQHNNWVDATNDKFRNMIDLADCDSEYIYYFDADTSVSRDFTEEWFIGDLVGGEHYGNRSWLANGAGFDKNPASKAYVPIHTILPCTYHYGAFFGGKKDKVIDFCKTLREWQIEDKKIPYEPAVNDESYINAYFHFNPPTTVSCENFAFDISHKGGLGETRDTKLNVEHIKKEMLLYKDSTYDISNGKLTNIKKSMKTKVVHSENPLEHWSDIEDLDNKIVLDLGCGWIDHGHASTPDYFISRGASKVIGVDVSNNEIEKLKELYPEHIFILRMIDSADDFADLISTYKPDVIKMDVEGAEIYLKDVPKEVFSSVKEFAIEYHNPECKKVLTDKFDELDFEITALNSFGYYQTDPNIMGIIHSKKR
jgi:hypothetical protein